MTDGFRAFIRDELMPKSFEVMEHSGWKFLQLSFSRFLDGHRRTDAVFRTPWHCGPISSLAKSSISVTQHGGILEKMQNRAK